MQLTDRPLAYVGLQAESGTVQVPSASTNYYKPPNFCRLKVGSSVEFLRSKCARVLGLLRSTFSSAGTLILFVLGRTLCASYPTRSRFSLSTGGNLC